MALLHRSKKLPSNHHFTVLMSHFGLEGEVPGLTGAISPNVIAPLKGLVNYLALGHVHKPLERDGWIYNPGSLETCGMDERNWHGGWYHVTVDAGTHQASHCRSHRRPMHRIRVEVDRHRQPQELYDAIRADLKDYSQAMKLGALKPVVQVWLEGVLAFDRHDLDLNFIEQMIVEEIDPLKARVHNNTRSTEYEVIIEDRLDRAELERGVLTDLIIRDSRYRDQADAWADLMSVVKTMALTGNEPAEIATAISKRLAQLDSPADSTDPLKTRLSTLKGQLEN